MLYSGGITGTVLFLIFGFLGYNEDRTYTIDAKSGRIYTEHDYPVAKMNQLENPQSKWSDPELLRRMERPF